MSAIVGLLHRNGKPVDSILATKLMGEFDHFPADYRQVWKKDRIFLGCIGQCITPESLLERLPFYDQEKELVITADAIIDNRTELFERLQIAFPDRKQMTDSELIILAYKKWGEDCTSYLIGDFAFMIWDIKKQTLFGARDLTGVRTLYYAKNEHDFCFSTLIKPLISLPNVKKELNNQWLSEFLAIESMVDSVDASSTPYQMIKQVPPGHAIIVNTEQIKLFKYGSFLPEDKIKFKSNSDYEEAFKEIFQEAVNNRLRTYRNIGSQLSGGLDSGSVVSFAANMLAKQNKPLHTFSYVPLDGFIDWTPKWSIPDESSFINATIQHVGNIKGNFLNFAEKSSYTEIDKWLDLLEMPYKFFENTFWIRGCYEKAQELDIGVLLTGARGNYSISFGPSLDYYSLLLRQLRIVKLYQEIKLYSQHRNVGKKRLLKIITSRAMPTLSKRVENRLPALISQEFAEKSQIGERLNNYELTKDLNSFLTRRNHFEQPYYWNKSGIVGTKLSLKYGLWERDPTNDPRIIRFCLAIPIEQYLQNGIDRSLIRRVMKDRLPDKVRLNQNTRGVQGADWLERISHEKGNVVDELQEIISNPIATEYLNSQVLKNAILKLNEKQIHELAADPDIKVSMRAIIFYRFIQRILV